MSETPFLIQAVDRAINLLDIIAKGGENGIALKDLSQQMGVNASTTHHLVMTLVYHRILEQDPDSKRYRLGTHLVELGNAALNSTSLARVAQPYLERVYDVTGHSVSFLVFYGLLRTPLLGVRSHKVLGANSAPLDVYTLHATGSGKLLLAYLPEPEVSSFLKSQRLERFTGNTFSDPERLVEELGRIRERGISFDMEEYGRGVRCISVPVRDATKRVIACMDLVFPTLEVDQQAMDSMTELMSKAASELSTQLLNMGLTVS